MPYNLTFNPFRRHSLLALVTTCICFCQLLAADESGYWREGSIACDTASEGESFDHLKHNSRYLVDPSTNTSTNKRGLCFGMACAYLQATLTQPDHRNLLGRRLEICSQAYSAHKNPSNKLENRVKVATTQFEQFRLSQGLLDNPETLQAYSRMFPESAELVDAHLWLKWLHREQFRQNGCSTEVTDNETPSSSLKMTQAWPVATTQSSTLQLLRALVELPSPAHYLLTSGQHAVALSVEKDHLTLFDQNAPCYFLRVGRTQADDLAHYVFQAMSAYFSCIADTEKQGANIVCGPYSAFVPMPGLELFDWDWDRIEQSMKALNQKHPLAVWSLQAVMPANTTETNAQESEWRMEWLTSTLMETLPTHINAADARGYTRLHLASRSGNNDSVKTLLEAGADAIQTNLDGYSAYDFACIRHPDTTALLEESLLAKGIHPQCQRNGRIPNPLEMRKPWHPSSQPIPGNLFQAHQQALQDTHYDPPPHPASFSSRDSDHCASDGCAPAFTDNSWKSFRFRKALGAIGRGEDPVSRFVDRIEQVQDNVVRFVTDRHPTLQAISISSRQVAGSFIAEQIDLLDRATGRVVSQSWNNLDQNLKDEFNGLLKVAAVVPVTRTKLLFEFRRYLDNVESVPRTKLVSDMESVGLALKGQSPDGKFMEFVDKQGTVRAKIYPPDKVTPYHHLHIYNMKQQPLDKKLNHADQRSSDAHIKISGNEQ